MPRVAASLDALLAALGDEALGAAALMQRLGCSQPTLSRMVRAAGESVITLGRAQQTRYARVRATGAEQPIVVTRIDVNGAPHSCGVLHVVGQLSGSRTVWVAERRVEVFAGLPWFVADMRPQGFMGRQFPARVPHLGLPPGAGDWSDNHVLQALCAAGADEPGDLILGRAALDLFLHEALPEPVTPRRKAAVYAQWAAQAHDITTQSGNRSSAGGEQAKFTAYVQTSDGAAHVLVKFSPEGANPVAQRWRDLLRAEHHALSVLSESAAGNGLHAAQSQLIDADRLYLEVRRFDRIGARGRSGVVSLGAMDDGFVGQRQSWVQTAQQLQRQRLLREADVQRIALLQAFGRLIHNTDMHFGNCALLHEGPGSRQFTLAPVYDMLPMRFAPTSQGLRKKESEAETPPVLPTADVLPVWTQALGLARAFWTRVLDDGEISRGFARIARAAMP